MKTEGLNAVTAMSRTRPALPSSYRRTLDFVDDARGARKAEYQVITGTNADGQRVVDLHALMGGRWEHGHSRPVPASMTDDQAMAHVRDFILRRIDHGAYNALWAES